MVSPEQSRFSSNDGYLQPATASNETSRLPTSPVTAPPGSEYGRIPLFIQSRNSDMTCRYQILVFLDTLRTRALNYVVWKGYSDALAEKLAYEEKKCTIVRKRVRECRAPPGNKVGFAVDTFVKYGSIKKEIELKPLGPCMEGNIEQAEKLAKEKTSKEIICFVAPGKPNEVLSESWAGIMKKMLFGRSLIYVIFPNLLLVLLGLGFLSWNIGNILRRGSSGRSGSMEGTLSYSTVSVDRPERLGSVDRIRADVDKLLARHTTPTNMSSNDKEETCAICLDQIEMRSEPGNSPENGRCELICHHAFHRNCIRQWLSRQSVCPVCKLALI